MGAAFGLAVRRGGNQPVPRCRAAVRLGKRRSTAIGRDAGTVLAHPRFMARVARARLFGQPALSKPRRTGFVIGSEQVPDPDSRITLGEARDRFGTPVARTDWRINH